LNLIQRSLLKTVDQSSDGNTVGPVTGFSENLHDKRSILNQLQLPMELIIDLNNIPREDIASVLNEV